VSTEEAKGLRDTNWQVTIDDRDPAPPKKTRQLTLDDFEVTE